MSQISHNNMATNNTVIENFKAIIQQKEAKKARLLSDREPQLNKKKLKTGNATLKKEREFYGIPAHE